MSRSKNGVQNNVPGTVTPSNNSFKPQAVCLPLGIKPRHSAALTHADDVLPGRHSVYIKAPVGSNDAEL